MNARQLLLVANGLVIAACILILALIIASKWHRSRRVANAAKQVSPHRQALLAVAAGEDDDGVARGELSNLKPPVWKHMNALVVSMLSNVRGTPASELALVLEAHGEVDRARRMTHSRSSVQRSRGAYRLGLIGDRDSVDLLINLLSDKAAEVRLVATRALGAIGDPVAAAPIIEALRQKHGRIGVPAWIAEEALLRMGMPVAPVVLQAMTDDEHGIRNVGATVAGLGTFVSTAPTLRRLLGSDLSSQVRRSAAVSLGNVGDASDVGILAAHTGAQHPQTLRRVCAESLGTLGHPDALPVLTTLLGDYDQRVAQLAADAMVLIGLEGISALKTTTDGQSRNVARAALQVAGLRGLLPVGRHL